MVLLVFFKDKCLACHFLGMMIKCMEITVVRHQHCLQHWSLDHVALYNLCETFEDKR
jgi:hypothetical protein